MNMRTRYEWTIEEVDEHGDIQCVDFRDRLAEFNASPKVLTERDDAGLVRDIGVAKSVHNTLDDDLEVRAYAYIDKDTLELDTEFDNGDPVPKKLIAEAVKWREAHNA